MSHRTGAGAGDTLVARYVEAALAAPGAGDADLGTLCAEHPELIPAVREGLAIARSLQGLAPVSDDPFLATTLAGRYELRERIGAGSMGAVYAGVDRELGRGVAVKLLQPGLFPSAAARSRFLREAELLAKVRHPHVVAVYDRGEGSHGVMFLVMELVQGCSLARILALAAQHGGGSPVPRAFTDLGWLEPVAMPVEGNYLRLLVRWSTEIARALAAAHALGICHRDVKPSNVLLDRDGRAVLVDFGIATRADDASLTATHATLGTPWYLPPERARGHVAPAPAQDIYSLGATLYHLLTGQPPFEGDAAAVLARLQSELPVPAHLLHPGLPRDLQAILDVAMHPEAERRYRDAAAMAADLDAFLDHRQVAARPRSGAARMAWRVRRRPAAALGVAAAVATLALGAVAWSLTEVRAEARNRDRIEQQRRLIAGIPALLALEGNPDERLLEDLASRAESLALLDAILALGEDLPTRLLRAALRLDHGDHAGAAADLEVLVAQNDSPHLREVARRYRAADGSRRGIQAVDLAGLPEPVTDVDCFVAGFHLLRARDQARIAEVVSLLQRAGDRYRPARDLRLLALLLQADTTTDAAAKQALYQRVYDEALMLAEHGKTARTQHAIGAACLGLRRYADAEAPLREALALRPDRHGPLNNLGIALYHLDRLEEAEEFLRRAQRVQPWSANTRHTLARVQCARGQFDAAEATAGELPDGERGGWNWKKPHFLGHIAVQRAFAALRAGDDAGARTAAAAAVSHYEAAVAVAPPDSSAAHSARAARAYAAAIVQADWDMALVAFLDEIATQVDNPIHLANAATLIRRGRPLSPRVAGRFKELLLQQALGRSPDRADLGAMLEETRQENEQADGR